MDWSRIRYFKRQEFDSQDEPGSGDRMNQQFVETLDAIRSDLGHPIIVTSGYRTPARNELVGGVDESEHCDGEGVDLSCRNSLDRFMLVGLALKHGIRRIGIYRNHVHLGASRTLPAPRMWTY